MIDGTEYDAPASPVAGAEPLLPELEIPMFLRPVPPETFELLIDGNLPVVKLAKALAAEKLSVRYWKGKLVLTNRPEEWK